jgi:hypothetical protein
VYTELSPLSDTDQGRVWIGWEETLVSHNILSIILEYTRTVMGLEEFLLWTPRFGDECPLLSNRYIFISSANTTFILSSGERCIVMLGKDRKGVSVYRRTLSPPNLGLYHRDSQRPTVIHDFNDLPILYNQLLIRSHTGSRISRILFGEPAMIAFWTQLQRKPILRQPGSG